MYIFCKFVNVISTLFFFVKLRMETTATPILHSIAIPNYTTTFGLKDAHNYKAVDVDNNFMYFDPFSGFL